MSDEISKKNIYIEDNESKSEESNEVDEEKEEKIKFDSIKIIDDYVIKETLGKGTFSTVKLGENIKTKQKVAIKILNKEKIKAKEDLIRIKREIKILSMMDHPNIIKTYKITENEKNYYIIMEYCDGGELFNYIVEKEKLEEDEASMFFYQLINALDYIHSLGIAHRDLKPENLLLLENKTIKIIDFGLSNYFNGEKELETPCGSPSYASPEIIKGEHYNGFSIDIWASGIIMFAMLCGYLPFDDDEEEEEEDSNDEINEETKYKSNKTSNDNSKESGSDDNEVLFEKILEGKVDFPSYLSKNAIDLMKKILVVDPKKRIQMQDIKKHKFYLLGKKNFLLNQQKIIAQEITKSLFSIDILEEDNNNINKKDINENITSHENKLIAKNNINNDKKASSKRIIHSDKKDDEKKVNMNININKSLPEKKNADINKKIINENIKEEMEEYEKKLFENYLKNVISIRKKNLVVNKNKYNNKIEDNKNSYILNTINIHPKSNILNKNLTKYGKNQNNYTLNEIFLNFNPNDININKKPSNLFFNNKKNIFIPLTKINHSIKKNNDDSINSIKHNNIFYNNENNRSLTKESYHNHLTINIPEISTKRRNNTKNKLLKDIQYYIKNRNNKNNESNKQIRYFKVNNLNLIENKNYNFRDNINKPFLPIIKPSLFNVFSNNSISQNRDSSILNQYNHLKTESTYKNSRKRIILNEIKNDFKALGNNTKKRINNDLRCKLFSPEYKNYFKPF